MCVLGPGRQEFLTNHEQLCVTIDSGVTVCGVGRLRVCIDSIVNYLWCVCCSHAVLHEGRKSCKLGGLATSLAPRLELYCRH